MGPPSCLSECMHSNNFQSPEPNYVALSRFRWRDKDFIQLVLSLFAEFISYLHAVGVGLGLFGICVPRRRRKNGTSQRKNGTHHVSAVLHISVQTSDAVCDHMRESEN